MEECGQQLTLVKLCGWFSFIVSGKRRSLTDQKEFRRAVLPNSLNCPIELQTEPQESFWSLDFSSSSQDSIHVGFSPLSYREICVL